MKPLRERHIKNASRVSKDTMAETERLEMRVDNHGRAYQPSVSEYAQVRNHRVCWRQPLQFAVMLTKLCSVHFASMGPCSMQGCGSSVASHYIWWRVAGVGYRLSGEVTSPSGGLHWSMSGSWTSSLGS